MNEELTNYAHKKQELSAFAKKTFRDYYPYFILVFDILFTVASKLFTASLVDFFTADYFINLVTTVATTMLCYSTFLPYGYSTERLLPEYSASYTRWVELSRKVRNGMTEEFILYCKASVDRERENRRRAIVENNTLISFAVYAENYARLSSKQLKALYREGKLQKNEYRAFLRANSRLRVKPINPILALSGTKTAEMNDAMRHGGNRNAISIASRPFAMVATSVIFSAFAGRFTGLNSFSAFFAMLYTILMIILSSVLGYSKGSDNAKKELDLVKVRIIFLETFLGA